MISGIGITSIHGGGEPAIGVDPSEGLTRAEVEDVRTAAKRIEPGPRAGIGVLEAPTAFQAEFRRAEFHELDQPFGIAGDVIP
jgi:hypothetical protein